MTTPQDLPNRMTNAVTEAEYTYPNLRLWIRGAKLSIIYPVTDDDDWGYYSENWPELENIFERHGLGHLGDSWTIDDGSDDEYDDDHGEIKFIMPEAFADELGLDPNDDYDDDAETYGLELNYKPIDDDVDDYSNDERSDEFDNASLANNLQDEVGRYKDAQDREREAERTQRENDRAQEYRGVPQGLGYQPRGGRGNADMRGR